MDSNWVLEQGRYGVRMVLLGSWSSAALKAFRRSGARELELNYAKGWKGLDLSFLGELLEMESLEVLDWTIKDVEDVRLLHGLRSLKLHVHSGPEMSVEDFPELESLNIEWSLGVDPLIRHPGLRDVFVNRYPHDSVREFGARDCLAELTLASPQVEDLEGLSLYSRLRCLRIFGADRLVSVAGLSECSLLSELEISDCKGVERVDFLEGLVSLKSLSLCDLGELDSLSAVRGLVNLEALLFYGSTKVLDGDLSPLDDLPKLKQVSFANRRHYNRKVADFRRR